MTEATKAQTELASTEVSEDTEGAALMKGAESPTEVGSLLHLAVERDVPVETLERLMDLHERVEKRDARAAFLEALAGFQDDVPEIKKAKEADITTKSGSSYGYTYAPLEEITRTIKPALREHGLSYAWSTEPSDRPDFLNVVCILRHVAGHEERATFPVPTHTKAAMSAAQKQGAALTYGKRQSLTSVLGLTTADDTDGAGKAQPIDSDQIKEINDKVTELDEKYGVRIQWNAFLDYLGVDALDDLTVDRYPKAIEAIDKKLEKAKKEAEE